MAKRLQSPSSINLYNQCPRKYYYQYIKNLKTLPSIHLIRGSAVHKVLEDFYEIDAESWKWETLPLEINRVLQDLFLEEWQKRKPELEKLNLDKQELAFFFEESVIMITGWARMLVERMKKNMEGKTPQEVFREITPAREKRYVSEEKSVQGFIDVIEELDGKIRLMDYKTSNKSEITDAYRLQLGIYAVLYYELHGKKPDNVGIYFLKNHINKEILLDVDEELMEFAKKEITVIHEKTVSDHISDYPKKKSPLCKWRTGQCDFYDLCFTQKTLQEWKALTEERSNVKLVSSSLSQ